MKYINNINRVNDKNAVSSRPFLRKGGTRSIVLTELVVLSLRDSQYRLWLILYYNSIKTEMVITLTDCRYCVYIFSFFLNACAIISGTNWDISPCSEAISLTSEELMKIYFSEGIKNIVSIFGASLRFISVNWSS